jgi:hypothetical protein
MYGFKLSVSSRLVSLLILLVVVTTTAAPPCDAAGLFSLGAGYSRFRESQALVWDPSLYLTGTYFLDIRPHLQLGLSASYYFLQVRPPSDLFGIGAYWEEPDGDGWMFSLLPAVRVPFLLGDDGSTQVYLQGGVGWYHIDMDVMYTGSIPGSDETEIEKRVTAKWDKPGIDGRFGVITRLDKALFLEISPGISVIFTDEESTWSLSGYIAVALML